ncbi:peptidylprolyl isomerase [Catenovulum agarivorans]|uniref:peptidylprolyl isomerase n=1 Tax=Catenovulum agarivorans TaxID=1172192 RepID=UPI0002E3D062|nr:peptidyl-prolyl cis-trans isomerase [Catenovulum agarivorans]
MKLWYSHIACVLFGGCLVWVGQNAFHQPELFQPIVAKVGEQSITVAEFKQTLQLRGGVHAPQVELDKLLDEMVLNAAIVHYAKDFNQDKLFDYQYAANNLLIGQIKQQVLQPKFEKISVSSEEIKQYYHQNPNEFIQPEKAKIAIIFQRFNGDRAKQKIQLQQARDSLINQLDSDDFGGYAIELSDDQASRYRGGQVGWVFKNQASYLPDEIVAKAFVLEEGEVSKVIETNKGLYLLRVLDKTQAEVKPLKQVEAQIRHSLVKYKQQQAVDDFEQLMLANVTVEKYLNNLPSSSKGSSSVEKPPIFN